MYFVKVSASVAVCKIYLNLLQKCYQPCILKVTKTEETVKKSENAKSNLKN